MAWYASPTWQSIFVTSTSEILPLSTSIGHNCSLHANQKSKCNYIKSIWLLLQISIIAKAGTVCVQQRSCLLFLVNSSVPFSLDVITTDSSNDSRWITKSKCQPSVREGEKKTCLTIKREVYCCTNSITWEEGLVNKASDPNLMGWQKQEFCTKGKWAIRMLKAFVTVLAAWHLHNTKRITCAAIWKELQTNKRVTWQRPLG